MNGDDVNSRTFPFGKPLGMRVAEINDGVATGEMPVPDEICTKGEILPGGAVMALAESMGATAAFAQPRLGANSTTIIESKTNFVRLTLLRETAFAASTALHQGRSTHVTHTLVHHR